MPKQSVLREEAREEQPMPLLERTLPQQYFELATKLALLGTQSATQLRAALIQVGRLVFLPDSQRRQRRTNPRLSRTTTRKHGSFELSAQFGWQCSHRFSSWVR
ncbi:hypothetical protein [Phytoactinopolyspora endophytica]|uniref:hypothetical protein n=1 Tax=Phytoactinopolyspora endophytica TaxID=1642495 RepID=UPI0013EA47CE|nr:hypothetical protein [Phytoactinopolyspora endophytica]